ncbi:hypothetical protein RCZ04_00780 [Capnocytophaga sp. HP1101]
MLGNSHSFNALLGQESMQSINRGFGASSQGQPSDVLSMLSHGTLGQTVNDGQTVYTFNSYFARLEYNYNNKYFLDISGRRDGSSAFGRNHRYANFWAIGAMWKLKEEAFLNNAKWINELNLRISTGLSGNSSIGNYRNRTLFTANRYYKESNGFFTQSLGNPDLMWEEQRKTSIGLSAIIFRNTSLV